MFRICWGVSFLRRRSLLSPFEQVWLRNVFFKLFLVRKVPNGLEDWIRESSGERIVSLTSSRIVWLFLPWGEILSYFSSSAPVDGDQPPSSMSGFSLRKCESRPHIQWSAGSPWCCCCSFVFDGIEHALSYLSCCWSSLALLSISNLWDRRHAGTSSSRRRRSRTNENLLSIFTTFPPFVLFIWLVVWSTYCHEVHAVLDIRSCQYSLLIGCPSLCVSNLFTFSLSPTDFKLIGGFVSPCEMYLFCWRGIFQS